MSDYEVHAEEYVYDDYYETLVLKKGTKKDCMNVYKNMINSKQYSKVGVYKLEGDCFKHIAGY